MAFDTFTDPAELPLPFQPDRSLTEAEVETVRREIARFPVRWFDAQCRTIDNLDAAFVVIDLQLIGGPALGMLTEIRKIDGRFQVSSGGLDTDGEDREASGYVGYRWRDWPVVETLEEAVWSIWAHYEREIASWRLRVA